MSGSLVKIIVGAVLIVVGVWWIVQGSGYIQPVKDAGFVTSRPALADLITLVNGGLPPFIVLIGLLVVWLEWDNFKIQKELAKEEKKE
ncbi:MAG: hypothetical protein HYS62_01710 [Candidatus Aenigmarchaeota archaeon]|nr:hypothetical protein [Candidatus Aenigmarchaeota archaeon]